MLKTIFDEIPDHRRAQGRMYELSYILLFTVFAILSGAKSYREIASYIKSKFMILKKAFWLKWKKPPSYSTIRNIIQNVDKAALERALRKQAKLIDKLDNTHYRFLSTDGKTLRGSFDTFEDQKAIQILSVFNSKSKIILAHEEIKDGDKTNEIPKVQKLIEELDLDGTVVTLDALHCQKKL